ncbi:ABC transporter permease [Lactovum miscens]|uniref:Uncharacterized protein n=1 Tax=Lactovum miscens TaxID=190387 RepID=A0A841C780_9LACT|nr:ABC transporter permease [Lactovum miscens]MBB5888335.1 hypothetical protein [Lactovum miscens]
MKFKTAVEYRLLRQVISLGIFFAWWFLFGIIFPVVGLLLAGGNEKVSSDVLIPIMIFSVIISFIGMYSDFKFFIQNGMNRFNIFLVNVSVVIMTSIGTSIIVFLLSKVSIKNFDLTVFLTSVYSSKNPFVNILLIFTLLLFLSSLGLLLGTFNDMFTGVKKIVILLLAMSIPVIVATIVQLGGEAARNYWINLLKDIVGYSNKNGFSLIPLFITLFVCSALCIILFYVLNSLHEIRHKGV